MHLGQSEVVLPQRQSTGTGHNGAGIEIIGERHGNGALQGT